LENMVRPSRKGSISMFCFERVDLSFVPSPNFYEGLGAWEMVIGLNDRRAVVLLPLLEVFVPGFYDKGIVFGREWWSG
jgi:hypothetical protein